MGLDGLEIQLVRAAVGALFDVVYDVLRIPVLRWDARSAPCAVTSRRTLGGMASFVAALVITNVVFPTVEGRCCLGHSGARFWTVTCLTQRVSGSGLR